MGYNNIPTINENIQKDTRAWVMFSEQVFAQQVDRQAQHLHQHPEQRIVMLAGPSASGKTTTAKLLAQRLEHYGHRAIVVSLDNFYKERVDTPLFEDGTPDYETVHALDLAEIEHCFLKLIRAGQCDLPVFDFSAGGIRLPERERVHLKTGDVVIVEGLHALNPLIADPLPQKNLHNVYISVSSRIYDQQEDGRAVLSKRDLRFLRRLVRDAKFRASDAQRTYELWQGVRKGEDRYLFCYKDRADVRINSLHYYEPCVLREQAIPLLQDVSDHPIWGAQARDLALRLEVFLPMETSLVPDKSLLREFLGT